MTDKTLEQAWSDINATMRTITSREIFQAYQGGLRYLPAGGAGKKVASVLEKYGHEMLMYCAEHGVSRGMFQWAETIADYVGMSGEQEYIVEKISPWLVELKMQKRGRDWVETGHNRNELKSKIDKFEPIEFK